MRNISFLLAISIFSMLLLASFTIDLSISTKYLIKIDGVEAKHKAIISNGISKEDLGEMTVYMKKNKAQVIKFNVTVA